MVDLAYLDKMYNEVEPAPDNVSLPDGIYAARVDRAEIKETKEKGYPMLALDLIVIAGEQEGRHAFLNMVFTGTKENAAFCKRDLLKLGYAGTMSQLVNSLESFLDTIVEIQIKTKADKNTGEPRTNTYLGKQIEAGPGVGSGNGGGLPAANFAPAGKGKPKGSPPPALPPEEDEPF